MFYQFQQMYAQIVYSNVAQIVLFQQMMYVA